jgi:predicted alpha/beta superfamily hydrolase
VPPHTIVGDVRIHEIASAHLNASRTFAVWLPPGYDRDDGPRYPVFYLHDGQNVFDKATAFGEEWQVDETATRLMKRREIAPLIVVGVYNGGSARGDEYTASVDAKAKCGGGIAKHERMLVDELKPWVDRTYRTKPGTIDTALGGSSLGGLATLHIGLRNPGVFGKLAVVSPAVWWDNRAIIKEVDALQGHLPLRIWLDAGTAEDKEVIPDTRALRDALLRKGWRLGHDLSYFEAKGAGHDEKAWAKRVGPILHYLYPGEMPLAQPTFTGLLRRWRDRWRIA